MGERVQAHSLTHEGSSSELYFEDSEPLTAGGHETKAVVTACIGNRAISLVERVYDARYITAWRAFRRAKMPVVPTLRVKGDNEALLVTDIKADGSEVYGKGLSFVLSQGQVRERCRPDIDALFIELAAPGQFEAIEANVHEYRELADRELLRLPYDDPFELLVKPDGTWQVITLDLRYGYALSENASKIQQEEAVQYNESNTMMFLRQLQRIQAHLASQQQRPAKSMLARLRRRP